MLQLSTPSRVIGATPRILLLLGVERRAQKMADAGALMQPPARDIELREYVHDGAFAAKHDALPRMRQVTTEDICSQHLVPWLCMCAGGQSETTILVYPHFETIPHCFDVGHVFLQLAALRIDPPKALATLAFHAV